MSLAPITTFQANDPYFRRWHNFGQGIDPNDLGAFSCTPSFLNRQHTGHRWHQSLDHLRENVRRSTIGKDGFQASFDVHQFAPNEITVKTLDDDQTIIVKGRHEERLDDHGYISRHFTRRFTIPDGYKIHDVIPQLSSDGVLTIKAPPPKNSSDDKARVLQIQHTGPAHLHIGNKEEVKEIAK